MIPFSHYLIQFLILLVIFILCLLLIHSPTCILIHRHSLNLLFPTIRYICCSHILFFILFPILWPFLRWWPYRCSFLFLIPISLMPGWWCYIRVMTCSCSTTPYHFHSDDDHYDDHLFVVDHYSDTIVILFVDDDGIDDHSWCCSFPFVIRSYYHCCCYLLTSVHSCSVLLCIPFIWFWWCRCCYIPTLHSTFWFTILTTLVTGTGDTCSCSRWNGPTFVVVVTFTFPINCWPTTFPEHCPLSHSHDSDSFLTVIHSFYTIRYSDGNFYHLPVVVHCRPLLVMVFRFTMPFPCHSFIPTTDTVVTILLFWFLMIHSMTDWFCLFDTFVPCCLFYIRRSSLLPGIYVGTFTFRYTVVYAFILYTILDFTFAHTFVAFLRCTTITWQCPVTNILKPLHLSFSNSFYLYLRYLTYRYSVVVVDTFIPTAILVFWFWCLPPVVHLRLHVPTLIHFHIYISFLFCSLFCSTVGTFVWYLLRYHLKISTIRYNSALPVLRPVSTFVLGDTFHCLPLRYRYTIPTGLHSLIDTLLGVHSLPPFDDTFYR